MWAVRASVVKTLSGHSRHTHTHCGLWYFSIMLWCFEMRCQALLDSSVLPMRGIIEYCAPLSRSRSKTLIDSLFVYSVSHALALSRYLTGSVLNTKWNLAHLQNNCWTAITYTTVGNCQYAGRGFGSGHLIMTRASWRSLEILVWKDTMSWRDLKSKYANI